MADAATSAWPKGAFGPVSDFLSFPGTGECIAQAGRSRREAIADAEIDINLADFEIGHRKQLVLLFGRKGSCRAFRDRSIVRGR